MAYYLTVGNWNQTLPEKKGQRAFFTSKMAPQCRGWEIGDLLSVDLFNCIIKGTDKINPRPALWKVVDARWVKYVKDENGIKQEIRLNCKEKNAVKVIEIETS